MDWDSAIELTITGCSSKAGAIRTWIAMRCLLLNAANKKSYWPWLLPYVLCPMYNSLFNDTDQSRLSLKIPLHVARLFRTVQEQSSKQPCQPAKLSQTDVIQQFISDWVWSKRQVVLNSWLWGGCSSLGADLDQCDLRLWINCLSDVWQLISQANAPMCKQW